MKTIKYHKKFIKSYRSRIYGNKKLKQIVEERIQLFVKDRTNPLLADHVLKGTMFPYKAFSISHDLRLVYLETDSEFVFRDIGSHNQVY